MMENLYGFSLLVYLKFNEYIVYNTGIRILGAVCSIASSLYTFLEE